MAALNRGHLLIVDDETDLRTALRRMLAEQGYETVEAGSGEEAPAILTERDIDLLLTDLMLPEADGIHLLREGLQIDPHLVGILMTGQGTVPTAINAMKAGAFDYILKPFKLQALLPILSRPRGGITSASVPMLAGGKLVGVLNVNATRRPRPFTPGQVKVLTILASTGAAALEEIAQRKRAEEELRECQSGQRRFVREVLFSVTEGRLRLCDGPADLPAPFAAAGEPTAFTRAELGKMRRHLQRVATEQGLSEERWSDLVTGFGEATMNAVVHGGGRGEAWVCAGPEGTVQAWVKDRGKGIGFDNLHRATLERGYTTAGSMGHGFWLMIKTCDRIWLLTGPEGTTVALEQEREAFTPDWLSGPAPGARGWNQEFDE